MSNEILKWINWVVTPGAIIALIALAISYVKLRTQLRSIRIQEAKEKNRVFGKRKANLTAQIEKEPYFTSFGKPRTRELLRIYNDSAAEARNVKVLLDGKPLFENPIIPKNIKEITQIGPNSKIQYVISLSMESPQSFDCKIEWCDDSGEPGFYRTSLTY